MAAVDGTAVIVAFPAIADEFQTSVAWVGWVLTAFSLTLGITLPLVGRVVERVGQQAAFVGAVSIFLVGSLGCALSTSVEQLILFRALEGVGGGAFMPLAAGIVSDRFVENRARMIGLLTSFYPLGGIVGPNVGGLLVSLAGWRAIFLMNIPICLAAIALGAWLLRGARPPRRTGAVDVPGALLLGLGTLCIMTGLTLATTTATAWRELPSAGLVASGIALFALLILWERHAANPILDVAILGKRPFLAANLISFGIAAFIFAIFGLVPLFLTRAYGYFPSQIGLLVTPRALLTIIISAVVSFLLPRLGFRLPIAIGFALVAMSTILVAQAPRSAVLVGSPIPEPVAVAMLLAIAGVGLGFVLPASNSVGMDLLPDKVTAIAGMRGAFNVLGNVLGTTLSLLVVSLAATQAEGLILVFHLAGIGALALIALVPLLPDKPRPLPAALPATEAETSDRLRDRT
ncbi:MAG: MFS transporter [Chloroflexota bacterium]|nr:MFS transporter [Dehalococcoidia bacterium]MDW8255085.1 MFS transporter [Chloroflexota bacterium]